MMVVRRYVPSGSLRDLIYGVRPTLCKDVENHTCSHPTHPHTHPHTFIHTSHPTHPHTHPHTHSFTQSHPTHPHTFIHTSHPTHPHTHPHTHSFTQSHPTHPHTFIHTSHPTHPHTHPHTHSFTQSHPTHPHTFIHTSHPTHPHTHHIPHTLTYPTGKTQQSHTPEVCISTSQASVNVYSRHQEIWQTGFGGTSFPVRKRVCPRYDILKGRMLSAPSNYNKTGEFIRVFFPPPGHVHSGNVIIDEGSCK